MCSTRLIREFLSLCPWVVVELTGVVARWLLVSMLSEVWLYSG